MAPLILGSVTLVALLNYTFVVALLLNGSTLAICPTATSRRDPGVKVRAGQVGSSTTTRTLQESQSPGGEQGFPNLRRRHREPAPHSFPFRTSEPNGRRDFMAGERKALQKGIPWVSGLQAVRGVEVRKESTAWKNPVVGYFYQETIKTLPEVVIHDASRRALLRDISPPGLWPITDDQDKEYLRRRALLRSSSTAAVS